MPTATKSKPRIERRAVEIQDDGIEIDRTEAQLTRQEEIEIADAFRDLRTAQRNIDTQNYQLKGLVERPNNLVSTQKIAAVSGNLFGLAQTLEAALRKINKLLRGVAAVLTLAALVSLAGCGSHSQGNGGSDDSSTGRSEESTCSNGQCSRK